MTNDRFQHYRTEMEKTNTNQAEKKGEMTRSNSFRLQVLFKI